MQSTERYNYIDELVSNWTEDEKKVFQIQCSGTDALLEAGNLLADIINTTGINPKNLASDLNISEKYIQKILGGGDKNFSLFVFSAILADLGYKLEFKAIPINKG